jgi:TMEM175 potassium channel family protein
MSAGHSTDLQTSRVEALSDGVFAIAMTILVLTIPVPTAEQVPAAQLPGALRRLGPQVLVYVISFINLGVLWIGQHNQYHFVTRADRWFLWINIGYLLLISFIPLSTALLGHYPLERVALVVYGLNLIAATLALALHWQHATAKHRLVPTHLSPAVVRLGYRRTLGSAASYTGALLLALILPAVGLALFLAVPLLNILPYGVDRHLREARRKAGDDRDRSGMDTSAG